MDYFAIFMDYIKIFTNKMTFKHLYGILNIEFLGRGEIMRIYIKIVVLLLCISILSCLSSCSALSKEDKAEKITIRLVAPMNSYIEDFDTNVYKLWLEEQTGLNIKVTWLPAEDAEQIVRQQLLSGEGLPDAYIGFGSLDIFRNPNIQEYGEQGVIISLNDYIEKYGENSKALFAELPEHSIKKLMTSADGHIYFMPGFSFSTITRYRQIMWVNKGWLDALDMDIPTTTDEFRDMLIAFKDLDPNGNQVLDEIPMAGTGTSYSKQPYDFLFNSFIYNDINNSRILLKNSKVEFAPVKEEWREALKYINSLYNDGLYSSISFTQDDQQMKQLANDSRDTLGAFMSPGITMTVLQNSPEIMERYVGVGPLAGPEGVRLSTVWTPIPKPNGVITAACKYPEEVFKLFDLMLSEEASLMGRYGEKGVDWDYAESGEESIYGTPATINVINQLWNTTQNKHLMQICPYVSRPKYSGGVTWNGSTTDGEYMNAQAALLYQEYTPEEYIGVLIFTPEEEEEIKNIRASIDAHIEETVIEFITGKRDVYDDAAWAEYLKEFDNLKLDKFLNVAQKAYDRMK